MAMTLYGGPLSPFVARVALAAKFKGMKYKLTEPPKGSKSPEYLALNPFGKVPALKDGSTVLFESTVIVEYLDAKGKGKKLVPKAAKAAAQARLIGTIAGEYVQSTVGKFFAYIAAPEANKKAVADIEKDLHKALDAVEKLMPKGKYSCGARFSVADVYMAPTVQFTALIATKMGLRDPFAGRPKLKKYLAAIRKDKTARDILSTMAAEWKRLMGG